jgi:hypothetical protein
MKFSFVLILVFFVSCTKTNSPEGVLREFVDKRYMGKANMDYILSKVTGQLKKEIESMSPEEVETYKTLPNVQKRSLKISNQRCEENKCYITYILKYNTFEEKNKTFESETKKIAEIVNDEGEWKIAKISHIKTFHDNLEEIRPLEE